MLEGSPVGRRIPPRLEYVLSGLGVAARLDPSSGRVELESERKIKRLEMW